MTTESELKELIKMEHRRAELQRLDDGFDGCGCQDCQAFYRELDLSKYGNRVSYFGDIVLISERRKRPEPLNAFLDHLDGQEGVTKIHDKGNIPPATAQAQDAGIMQQEKRTRGRPRKDGPVNRVTLWRRQRKSEPGAMTI